MNEKCLDLLMYAIAKQAIKDYIALKKGRIKPSERCNKTELKRYFRGEFFQYVFPNISGEDMIKLLDSAESEKIFKRITKEEQEEKAKERQRKIKKVRIWK